VRDIQRAYQDAMVEEYESLVRGGRTAEARHVQAELKDRFGVEVGVDHNPAPSPPPPAPAKERADEPRPVEDTAEPKPAPRRGPGRPRKTAEASPSDKK
jgi:hypothetical protein